MVSTLYNAIPGTCDESSGETANGLGGTVQATADAYFLLLGGITRRRRATRRLGEEQVTTITIVNYDNNNM